LLYECFYAKFIWGLSQFPFNIVPPHNVHHMFGTWLHQFGGTLKRQVLAGASTFCWAIWLSRNELIFDKSPMKTFMQVLYRGTHWLWSWPQMERHDQDKEVIRVECCRLETIAMEIYVDHGWRFSNRICG
jgi:hypothetical protein